MLSFFLRYPPPIESLWTATQDYTLFLIKSLKKIRRTRAAYLKMHTSLP